VDVGGRIYHALNRANFRSRLFRETAHYEDFLGRLAQSERSSAIQCGSGKAIDGQDGRTVQIIKPEARPGPLIQQKR
jgi:hypothetical protein